MCSNFSLRYLDLAARLETKQQEVLETLLQTLEKLQGDVNAQVCASA